MNKNKDLTELLLLVNKYPSPHNEQPIRLKFEPEDHIRFYFDRARRLQSTDISYIFSFVSMGVFMVHLKWYVQALGHSLNVV